MAGLRNRNAKISKSFEKIKLRENFSPFDLDEVEKELKEANEFEKNFKKSIARDFKELKVVMNQFLG